MSPRPSRPPLPQRGEGKPRTSNAKATKRTKAFPHCAPSPCTNIPFAPKCQLEAAGIVAHTLKEKEQTCHQTGPIIPKRRPEAAAPWQRPAEIKANISESVLNRRRKLHRLGRSQRAECLRQPRPPRPPLPALVVGGTPPPSKQRRKTVRSKALQRLRLPGFMVGHVVGDVVEP